MSLRLLSVLSRRVTARSILIIVTAREEEVLRNVQAHNAGPMPHDSARRIFERIIDEMRTLQRMRMGSTRDGGAK